MNQFRKSVNGVWDIITKGVKGCLICDSKLKKIFSEGNVAVFENNLNVSPSKFNLKKNLYEYSNSHGWEEIIAYREHNTNFGMLSTDQISKLLMILKSRYSHLSLGESIKSIITYSNTLTHFSFDIIALPFVPTKIKEEMKNSNYFKSLLGSNMVVYSNENISIVVNPVPDSNYELIIIPNREINDITELGDDEIFSLAEALKISHKIFYSLGIKDYEVLFFNAPIGEKLYFHIYFKNIELYKTIRGYGINIINKVPEKLVGEINGQKKFE